MASSDLLASYNRYIPPSSRILRRQKLPAHREFLVKSLSRQVHGIATVAAVYAVHAGHQTSVVRRRVKQIKLLSVHRADIQ